MVRRLMVPAKAAAIGKPPESFLNWQGLGSSFRFVAGSKFLELQ
jgi:hypothetical protein